MYSIIAFFRIFCSVGAHKFSDYQVTDCPEFNKVLALETQELPQIDYVLKTVNYQWSKGENNFACKYFIVQWGCGTGCQMNAVFNQETGRHIASFNSTMGCEYRIDSKLIKIYGDKSHNTPDRFYVLNNEILTLEK